MTTVNENTDCVDYTQFGPAAYLDEYFLEWDVEDDMHMTFLHDSFGSIPKLETMIELAGGPSIYQLISARTKVDSIAFTDFLPANCREVQKWVNREDSAFNWDTYFAYVQKLENGSSSLSEMKDELRRKLVSFDRCDILVDEPLGNTLGRFDVVSQHYCIDAIASDREMLMKGLKNIASLMKPKGYLFMSFLRNARQYSIGDTTFASYPITEREATECLRSLNLEVLAIRGASANPKRLYPGCFSVMAQARK